MKTTVLMSGKNNVNPGQYKVGGRDRQDDEARERVKGAHIQTSKNVPTDEKPAGDKKSAEDKKSE